MTEFQKEIQLKYKKYESIKSSKENKCMSQGPIKLNDTQKFIGEYCKDTVKNKDGLLLYHTVGAGKTLTAVNILKTYEGMGYTCVWVTRTTLRKDLQKALDIIPLKRAPVVLSYKQFSNACKEKGQIYKSMAAKSQEKGGKEFLYKTIIIIDEAHKLYTKDLKAQEMHDINAIQKSIFKSYQMSATPCKLILMSATPITKDPKEAILLLNLLKSNSKDRLDVSIDKYFQGDTFNKEFKNKIQGLVSYINTSCDVSKFARSKIYTVPVEISDIPRITTSDCQALDKKCKSSIVTNKGTCNDRYLKCKASIKSQDYKSSQKFILSSNCGVNL